MALNWLKVAGALAAGGARRRATKRGREFYLTTLDADVDGPLPELHVTAQLDDALMELGKVDAPLADFRGISERSIQRE